MSEIADVYNHMPAPLDTSHEAPPRGGPHFCVTPSLALSAIRLKVLCYLDHGLRRRPIAHKPYTQVDCRYHLKGAPDRGKNPTVGVAKCASAQACEENTIRTAALSVEHGGAQRGLVGGLQYQGRERPPVRGGTSV
jgi:hypothetical protein